MLDIPDYAKPMLAKWREDLPAIVKGRDPWTVPRRVGEVTIADCVSAASETFNIPEHDILSERRAKDIAYARFAAIKAARDLTEKSLPQIGHALRRDHTTIMHALERVDQLCRTSGEYAQKCELVKKLAWGW